MYKSPIELVMGEMRMKLNGTITQAIQDVDINVDKEELERALQYDRGQYDKGYSDGYKDAVKEFAKRLKDEKHICLPPTGYNIDENDWVIYEDDINQVVEEMVGEV